MMPGAKPKSSILPRAKTEAASEAIKGNKVPSEFSRRPRPLEDGYKAEDLLYFFCIVSEAAAAARQPKVAKLWLRLGYIMRLYYASEEELATTSETSRTHDITVFLHAFIAGFGKESCTYNVHGLVHLERMRQLGPMFDISAIPFEGMFSVMRRSFRQGCRNVPMQIMETMYTRLSQSHACQRSIKFRDTATSHSDDTYIYDFSNTSRLFSFYKIVQLLPNDRVKVKELIVQPTDFGQKTLALSWKKVGAYAFSNIGLAATARELSSFTGKAIVVQAQSGGKYVFSIPNGVLRER